MASHSSGSEVAVVCAWGVSSPLCSEIVDAMPGETGSVVDAVSRHVSEERGVVLVSPGLGDAWRVVEELAGLGYNPFLVEPTGIPETMLSGLSLDELIAFHLGFVDVTMAARLEAKPRRPAVSRREALRRLFLVQREYVIPPRLRGSCPGDSCPYGAIEDGRLRLEKCRGCMACIHRCPAAEAPGWAGPGQLLYAYSYVSEKALDGILVLCRRSLPRLDQAAVEASPAKLLPLHVPCLGWIRARLLRVLEEKLHVPVAVYAPGLCGGCPAAEAVKPVLGEIVASGIRLVESLAPLSGLAYTGYSRPRLSPEEAAAAMEKAMGAIGGWEKG